MSRLTRMIVQPLGGQVGESIDVVGLDVRVGPVLRPVVFDPDFPLREAHVDAADEVDRTRRRPRSASAAAEIPRRSDSSRVRVSCGDSAPPSIRSTTCRNCTMPRAPRWRSAMHPTSTALRPVAFASASTRMIAVVSLSRLPRSNAVRAAVVTGIPSIVVTSSSAESRTRWMTMPSGGQRLGADQFRGQFRGRSTSDPCIAAADNPARVASRPAHSHAATARLTGVSSTSFGR